MRLILLSVAMLLALPCGSALGQSTGMLPAAPNASGRQVPCATIGTSGSTYGCTPAQLSTAAGNGTLSGNNTWTGVNVFGVGAAAGGVNLNANSGYFAGAWDNTSNVNRWFAGKNNTTETGVNVGSDYVILNYNDAGSVLGTPLKITRATGALTFDSVGAGAAFGGPVTNTMTNISVATGNNGELVYQTGGLTRWLVFKNATAETGSNAGSNFAIAAYADDGVTVLSIPLFITRSSGAVLIDNSGNGTTFGGSAKITTSLSVGTTSAPTGGSSLFKQATNEDIVLRGNIDLSSGSTIESLNDAQNTEEPLELLASSVLAPQPLTAGNNALSGVILTLINSVGTCTLTPTATTATFSCSSDQDLKSDIREHTRALGYLDDFHVMDYAIKSSGERVTGVIAQEVMDNHPEMVHLDSRSKNYRVDGVNPWELVKAIQELHRITDRQEAEIVALSRRVHVLERLHRHKR